MDHYDPDMEYERYLEHRMDDYGLADLAEHESAWPNGYGYCPEPFCLQEVYHPGEHTEATEAELEAHIHRHDGAGA